MVTTKDLLIALTPEDCQKKYALTYEPIHSFAVAGILVTHPLSIVVIFLVAVGGVQWIIGDSSSEIGVRLLLPLSDYRSKHSFTARSSAMRPLLHTFLESCAGLLYLLVDTPTVVRDVATSCILC